MDFEITLKKPELDYDIGMVTHVIMNREIGRGATQEQGFNMSNTQDESGEVHLIDRYIENAVNELIAELGRYLPEMTGSDNDLEGAKVGDFQFLFTVPDKFNRSYIGPLRSAMHEFVVNRVLFDWFIKTKPNEAPNYKMIYEDSLSKARSHINRRTGFTRIKPYPPI